MNYRDIYQRLQALSADYDREAFMQAYREMIVSASGWRKIFSENRDEQERNPLIPETDMLLVAHIALTMDEYLQNRSGPLIIARDARINGETIAWVILSILATANRDIRYLSIASAPECFAYGSALPDSVFLYISASHNPIAHNGFKFGQQGGVFNQEVSADLITRFRSIVEDSSSVQKIQKCLEGVSTYRIGKILETSDRYKSEALDAYYELILRTHGIMDTEHPLRRNIRSGRIGIVGELNGSARSVSIDHRLFEALSIPFLAFNDTPGEVVHEIVPEGENLDLCRSLVEQEHSKDPAFILGYVPDNDGDRGNIVYYDELQKKVKILSAQELFALITSIEVALARRTHEKVAIAVNGPTSLMIDHIGEHFGIKVARAEVGEAHVVQAGEILRSQGYSVPLVGEGSNGGIILHPSRVRDPANTLLSLIKLLTDRELFSQVTRLRTPRPSLALAIRSLEKRSITGSFSKDARLKITCTDHGRLKSAYERLFAKSFEKRKEELSRSFGIFSYSQEQTEGVTCTPHGGAEHRHPPYTGGFKILLHDREGNASDFLWMRGSGTEPVFRIMVDAQGDDTARHDELLTWHTDLVRAADKEAARN